MTDPVMKKAKGYGIELQLAVWEGKGNTPILCVHGLTANHRSFDSIAGALSPKFKVIAFDLRGRGLSDKPNTGYSIEHHVLDIKALMDDLNLDRSVLMGHSLGAAVVASFAAAHPKRVEKAILIDGAGKLNTSQIAQVFKGIKPSIDRLDKIFASFETYAEQMKRTPFFKPWTSIIDNYFRYETESVKGGVRSRIKLRHIAEEIENLVQTDITTTYKQIHCPCLILRAPLGMLSKDDILLPKNALKKMVGDIPNVWVVDLANTNHYSILFKHNTTRDRVIIDFIESC
ncbi:MAG: alpha/beta hydrolase [Proteobacteria bacterium]|nr:alpha/beta hydrolase [Pseudomonadota bacterium]